MLCYLKFRFDQKLCGEEHQYRRSSLIFFLKKASPKKLKKSSTLFDNRANKNEAINIIGFYSHRLAGKYGIISQISIYN